MWKRHVWIAAPMAGLVLGSALLIALGNGPVQRSTAPNAGQKQAKREPFSRPGHIRKSKASVTAPLTQVRPEAARDVLAEIRRSFPAAKAEFDARGVRFVQRGRGFDAIAPSHPPVGIATPGSTLKLRAPGAQAVSKTLDDPANVTQDGWTQVTLTAKPAGKGVATISVETFAGPQDKTYVDDIHVDQK